MRNRVLLAGLALAAVFALTMAAPAGAATSPTKLTKDNQACLNMLKAGKDVDDCQQAPSPILPPTDELVWGSISFVLVFIMLRKFAWPGIKAGMDGRTERIRSEIASAETQRTEASTILAEYRAQLADAKTEGARIIEEARQTADALKRDLQAQAQAEIAEMRAKNVADIAAAKTQAIADLRGEVANIAIGAAERVVERNLDRETNTALIESFIDQVGAGK